MRLRILLLLLVLVIVGETRAQNFIGSEQEIKSILQNISQFSESVMNADYDQIAAAYTADGKIFPGNRKIIEGRDSIREYWVQPEGSAIIFHKISPIEIKITGDEAYDYGYYEGKTRNANGEELSWKGKYVIIWRQEDGDWKIYLDIWNRVRE